MTGPGRGFVSCDWGTTSFRLKLIETQTGECVARFRSDKGNAVLYKEWKAEEGADRLHFYLEKSKTEPFARLGPDGKKTNVEYPDPFDLRGTFYAGHVAVQ